jgi:hypothetical protein
MTASFARLNDTRGTLDFKIAVTSLLHLCNLL